MKTYKIGRNQDADIVLSANYCSRDHALISISDNGKILLQDFSANGTTVNGKKINNQTVEINYGEEVLFGGVEKLDWAKIKRPIQTKVEPKGDVKQVVKQHKKSSFFTPQKIIFSIIGVGVLALFVFILNRPSDEQPLAPAEIYNRYKSTVALVEVRYYVRVKTSANDFYYGVDKEGDISHSNDKSKLSPFTSEGTAFFVDSLGKLVTNRHVLEPWNSKEMSNYFYKRIRPIIKKALATNGWGNQEPKFIGEIASVVIFVNGELYSKNGGVICSVESSAKDDQVDLAIIRTYNRKLPSNATYITSSEIETDKKNINVNTAAYVIGFPLGEALATNEEQIINCTSTKGDFTQESSKYYVQYSSPTAGGASGSPVFNEYGKLVAVNYLGSKEQNFNRGILAKYILDLN